MFLIAFFYLNLCLCEFTERMSNLIFSIKIETNDCIFYSSDWKNTNAIFVFAIYFLWIVNQIDWQIKSKNQFINFLERSIWISRNFFRHNAFKHKFDYWKYYLLIFIVSGNLLVILVVTLSRRLRSITNFCKWNIFLIQKFFYSL